MIPDSTCDEYPDCKPIITHLFRPSLLILCLMPQIDLLRWEDLQPTQPMGRHVGKISLVLIKKLGFHYTI